MVFGLVGVAVLVGVLVSWFFMLVLGVKFAW